MANPIEAQHSITRVGEALFICRAKDWRSVGWRPARSSDRFSRDKQSSWIIPAELGVWLDYPGKCGECLR